MGADTRVGSKAALSATARASSKKRKHSEFVANPPLNSPNTTIKSDTSAYAAHNGTKPATPSKKPRAAKPTDTSTEKRLRRFRPQPPKSFQEVYHRAATQRFYVLSRARHGTPDCPEETVELTGSTGNIYTVTVAQQPRCDCPHAREGNQCKHVLYVLARVLRARFELVYQLALLSEELREVFEGAPAVDGDGVGGVGGGGGEGGGKRKPVEGDCPICFCEMEGEGQAGGEPVVWCRAACGQNIHKGCFETWAATKRRQGGKAEVTCPYCRSVWEGDEDMIKSIQRDGKRNADGYVNVASQLGISPHRDHSTYSRWWSGHPSSYRRRYY